MQPPFPWQPRAILVFLLLGRFIHTMGRLRLQACHCHLLVQHALRLLTAQHCQSPDRASGSHPEHSSTHRKSNY